MGVVIPSDADEPLRGQRSFWIIGILQRSPRGSIGGNLSVSVCTDVETWTGDAHEARNNEETVVRKMRATITKKIYTSTLRSGFEDQKSSKRPLLKSVECWYQTFYTSFDLGAFVP